MVLLSSSGSGADSSGGSSSQVPEDAEGETIPSQTQHVAQSVLGWRELWLPGSPHISGRTHHRPLLLLRACKPPRHRVGLNLGHAVPILLCQASHWATVMCCWPCPRWRCCCPTTSTTRSTPSPVRRHSRLSSRTASGKQVHLTEDDHASCPRAVGRHHPRRQLEAPATGGQQQPGSCCLPDQHAGTWCPSPLDWRRKIPALRPNCSTPFSCLSCSVMYAAPAHLGPDAEPDARGRGPGGVCAAATVRARPAAPAGTPIQ